MTELEKIFIDHQESSIDLIELDQSDYNDNLDSNKEFKKMEWLSKGESNLELLDRMKAELVSQISQFEGATTLILFIDLDEEISASKLHHFIGHFIEYDLNILFGIYHPKAEDRVIAIIQ